MNTSFSKKILYADVDSSCLEAMVATFEKEGYELFFIDDGSRVVKIAQEMMPDVIVLEVILPNVDGIEICSELRKISVLNSVPIVFVSSRSEDFVQIAALDAGADGYLLKPIRSRLVFSHIKAIERRTAKSFLKKACAAKIFNPTLDIDEDKICAIVNGEEVALARREFEILQLLLSNVGKVFSRSEILSIVWQNDTSANERTIDVHITNLRKKIGESNIFTQKGLGYKVKI